MPRLNTESPYVWIKDPYHTYYPLGVKIIEVLPDGYRCQVQNSEEVEVILREDQLSSDIMGD
jgi:hypothetical protein